MDHTLQCCIHFRKGLAGRIKGRDFPKHTGLQAKKLKVSFKMRFIFANYVQQSTAAGRK